MHLLKQFNPERKNPLSYQLSLSILCLFCVHSHILILKEKRTNTEPRKRHKMREDIVAFNKKPLPSFFPSFLLSLSLSLYHHLFYREEELDLWFEWFELIRVFIWYGFVFAQFWAKERKGRSRQGRQNRVRSAKDIILSGHGTARRGAAQIQRFHSLVFSQSSCCVLPLCYGWLGRVARPEKEKINEEKCRRSFERRSTIGTLRLLQSKW